MLRFGFKDGVKNVSAYSEMTTVTDFIDVRSKIADLNCIDPRGLALLPINFESANSIAELHQASEAATIRKLLIVEGVPVDDVVSKEHRLPYVKNKSFEWIAPILFVSGSLYSQNPALVTVALNVVGSYATEFFRGRVGPHSVSLGIVVETRSGAYKKISYKGPVEGLSDLAKVIGEIENE